MEDLTHRQAEILVLLAEGLSDKAIVVRLNIQPTTVRTHVAHLKRRLGADTRTELGAKAVDLHLVRAQQEGQ
jgi:DNA-binding NarL/FixJ family response regulator